MTPCDRLASVEPAFHIGQALERPALEILQEVDGEIGALDIGGGCDIERPGLEALGIRPGVVVDIAAQEGDLDQVFLLAGHRPEQRDAVDEGAAADELAGIGVSRIESLVFASRRHQVDGIHRVMGITAGDLEEVVPAVHVLIALGRVLHIGVSEDIPIVSSVLIHIHALQSGKAGTPIPKMVGPPDRDAARRPERFPNGNPVTSAVAWSASACPSRSS